MKIMESSQTGSEDTTGQSLMSKEEVSVKVGNKKEWKLWISRIVDKVLGPTAQRHASLTLADKIYLKKEHLKERAEQQILNWMKDQKGALVTRKRDSFEEQEVLFDEKLREASAELAGSPILPKLPAIQDYVKTAGHYAYGIKLQRALEIATAALPPALETRPSIITMTPRANKGQPYMAKGPKRRPSYKIRNKLKRWRQQVVKNRSANPKPNRKPSKPKRLTASTSSVSAASRKNSRV